MFMRRVLIRLGKFSGCWTKLSWKAKFVIVFLNVAISLLIGLAVYVFFIPSAHISQLVYRLIGKKIAVNDVDLRDSFLTCYLADFLWAEALCALVALFVVEKTHDFIKVFLICVIFEVIIETLQLTPLIDGTFDFFDMLVEGLANCVSFAMIILPVHILRVIKGNY